MNHDSEFFDKSFEPTPSKRPIEFLIPSVAENFVIKTIINGSGGPDNHEITTTGLRFIRYLLSTSRAARHGFIPNFKDMAQIERLAKEFVFHCGSPSNAMEKVLKVAEGEYIT